MTQSCRFLYTSTMGCIWDCLSKSKSLVRGRSQNYQLQPSGFTDPAVSSLVLDPIQSTKIYGLAFGNHVIKHTLLANSPSIYHLFIFIQVWLVVWNMKFMTFPIILGMSSSQLTNSINFFRGVGSTTNQWWEVTAIFDWGGLGGLMEIDLQLLLLSPWLNN